MKTTVRQLFEAHRKDACSRVISKKLTGKTLSDYRTAALVFHETGFMNMPAESMKPFDFAKVMEYIEGSGRSLRTQKNIVTAIKTVFKWSGPEGMGIVDRVFFGPRFRAPSLRSIEVQQEKLSPSRFIDRETILAALDIASQEMRVAILLGINCGFYPSDTIAITNDHIHLNNDVPFHDFRRVKTGQQRKAVLWPETVEAIGRFRLAIGSRWWPDGNSLLRTTAGESYASAGSLIRKFSRLLDKIDPAGRRCGVSLGSLRHTYATIIDAVPDQAMIDLTMGHTNKSIQKRTYCQMNLDELSRLKVLSETVRDWLYGDAK